MVGADHSSSCGMHNGNILVSSKESKTTEIDQNELVVWLAELIFDGGAPAGFVIRFPQYGDISIYHAGDTGVFLDMKLIDELYKPTHLMIPIGGNFTMGPEEAAHCLKFFTNARAVIPMHFGTFPLLPGTFEDF